MEIRAQEREVVVAAVPDQHVRIRLRRGEDRRVVHAREDHRAGRHPRLVLLALLDRAAGRLEVGARREALHALAREIAVRHRMAQRGHAQPGRGESRRDPARGLRLPAAGPHRRHRDHRKPRAQHRRARARAARSPPRTRAPATRDASRAHGSRRCRRTPRAAPRAGGRAPRVRLRPRSGCRPGSAPPRATRGSADARCRGSAWR